MVFKFILEEEVETTIMVPTWNAPWKALLMAMKLETVILWGSAEELFYRTTNRGEEVFKNSV